MPKKRSTKTDSKASKQLNKQPKKPKTLTHAKAKKKADEWFSKYVRWSAADADGNCTCFTCGKTHHASRIQAGHFASRRHNATRYDLNNVRPQCAACNIFKQGEQWIFGRNLDREQRGRAEEIMRTVLDCLWVKIMSKFYPWVMIVTCQKATHTIEARDALGILS